MGVLNRNIAGSARLVRFITGPPGYIGWAYVAWRAGTKSANFAHPCLKLWLLDFAERDECKPVLLGLSLAENLVKPLMSLYVTEWRERGNGLTHMSFFSL